MNDLIQRHFAIFSPIFFVSLWLIVTTVLAVKSGWFALMNRFSDNPSEPVRLKIGGASGRMNGVAMSGILTLMVCDSGLRVRIMRVFGPFSRSFLVPWGNISVTRGTSAFFSPAAALAFGNVGSLKIGVRLADQLARAAEGRWPEQEPFPEETPSARVSRLVGRWAVMTAFAACFFIFAPMLLFPHGRGLPVLTAILFPAVVFGIGSVVSYMRGTD